MIRTVAPTARHEASAADRAGRSRLTGVLDTIAAASQRLADRAGLTAAAQRGAEFVGHPLHPGLTDLPIGFWTSSTVLDGVAIITRTDWPRRGARFLVAAGVLAALPTAAAGLGDLGAVSAERRRTAALHMVSNSAALICFTISWVRRRRGAASGRAWAAAGAASATFGAALGGRLAFGRDAGS